MLLRHAPRLVGEGNEKDGDDVMSQHDQEVVASFLPHEQHEHAGPIESQLRCVVQLHLRSVAGKKKLEYQVKCLGW